VILNIKVEKINTPSGKRDVEDTTLSEAIESIYDNYKDFVFRVSLDNNVKILLDFKGDLSSIINDIIKLHQKTLLSERQFMITFLSSSFTATWYVSNTDWVTISPKWTTAIFEKDGNKIETPNYSNYEDPIVTKTHLFIREWEKLLIEVREDLKRAGYGKELEGFEYLESLPSIKPES